MAYAREDVAQNKPNGFVIVQQLFQYHCTTCTTYHICIFDTVCATALIYEFSLISSYSSSSSSSSSWRRRKQAISGLYIREIHLEYNFKLHTIILKFQLKLLVNKVGQPHTHKQTSKFNSSSVGCVIWPVKTRPRYDL